MVAIARPGRPGRREKATKQVKKSYTTSPAIADEVVSIADEMGVAESAIVNFALRDWLMNYRREQHEANTRLSKSVSVA
ncbi:hypothetical protein GS682_04550 [Nostoc sp. B(2019)]|nr:hypothetical protein [Nostoc sp. B(2019)]